MLIVATAHVFLGMQMEFRFAYITSEMCSVQKYLFLLTQTDILNVLADRFESCVLHVMDIRTFTWGSNRADWILTPGVHFNSTVFVLAQNMQLACENLVVGVFES